MNTSSEQPVCVRRSAWRSALKQLSLVAALGIALVIPRPAAAVLAEINPAPDMVMVIDGIPGNSPLLKGAIGVISFSHGITATSYESGGGSGAVNINVELSPIYLTKRYDKSSPMLMQACATGKQIPKVTLYVRSLADNQQQILAITLENVLVTSVQSQAGVNANEELAIHMDGQATPGGFGTESVILRYTKISQTVLGDGDPVSFTWDLAKNSPL